MASNKSNSPAVRDTYVCKDITATLGDWNPPVSRIVIELAESTIPLAYLIVDPAHTERAEVTPGIKGTLSALKAWTDRAQRLAAQPDSRAQVHIKLASKDGVQKQELELKDWIIVAAGMTGVSASGSFSLEILIQHPVGRLDRSVSGLGNGTKEPEWWYADYTDPVTGFATAYADVAAIQKFRVAPTPLSVPGCAESAGGGEGLAAAYSRAAEQMVAKATEITQYLKWVVQWPGNEPGYSNLPLADSCFANPKLQQALKEALTNYVPSNESSIWSTFANGLLEHWQLSLVPTYWDQQLLVMPYSPWGNPSITVYDDEISDINFPAVDPAPLGGVRVEFTAHGGGWDQTYYLGNQAHQAQSAATEVLYLPPFAFQSEEPIGRVYGQGIPGWLSAVQYTDTAAASDASSPDNREKNGQKNREASFTTPANVTPASKLQATGGSTLLKPRAEFVGAVYRYANQVFLAKYRSNIEAQFTTCLLLRAGGSLWPDNYVVPGCVVRLATRADKTVFFDLHVKNITHMISVGDNQVWTSWRGAYCRGDGEFDGRAKNGTYNPLYL